MTSVRARRSASSSAERGFTSLEVAVGVAILSILVLASASTLGRRPPRAHAAAIALEAALVEGRSVAMATGDQTDPASPTGATVYVAPDPANARQDIVTVYRSRPIASGNPGGESVPLAADPGFAPQHVPAALSVRQGSQSSPAPFAVLISSSGYASIAAPLRSDPGATTVQLAADPGCRDGAVSIAADDGTRNESHPFSCRNAIYDASQ